MWPLKETDDFNLKYNIKIWVNTEAHNKDTEVRREGPEPLPDKAG